MNFLALDYGGRNVGYATGSSITNIAFPGGVLKNNGKEDLAKEVGKLLQELEIDKVIVGLPLKLEEKFSENRVMKKVKEFVDFLKLNFEIEIELYDERFSTYEAEQMMEEIQIKSQNKAKIGQDAYAAQVILQRYFDEV